MPLKLGRDPWIFCAKNRKIRQKIRENRREELWKEMVIPINKRGGGGT